MRLSIEKKMPQILKKSMYSSSYYPILYENPKTKKTFFSLMDAITNDPCPISFGDDDDDVDVDLGEFDSHSPFYYDDFSNDAVVTGKMKDKNKSKIEINSILFDSKKEDLLFQVSVNGEKKTKEAKKLLFNCPYCNENDFSDNDFSDNDFSDNDSAGINDRASSDGKEDKKNLNDNKKKVPKKKKKPNLFKTDTNKA